MRYRLELMKNEEFVAMQELLEDAEDLKLLREARLENADEPGISLEEAKQRLGI